MFPFLSILKDPEHVSECVRVLRSHGQFFIVRKLFSLLSVTQEKKLISCLYGIVPLPVLLAAWLLLANLICYPSMCVPQLLGVVVCLKNIEFFAK